MQTLTLDEDRFISTLRKLVSLGRRLQNCPDEGLVPEEKLAADVVLDLLRPHVESGFLRADVLSGPGFERRPSLVLTVRGTGEGTIGLVGAHLDVVPANREAEGWTAEPFQLQVSRDGTLYGRGVTDCLGHVSVLTDLLVQLAEAGIRPRRTLKVVLISNEEEAPIPECGLEFVAESGALDDLRDGPIYWLDSADFGPTVGTGGIAMWELTARGVTGHSGMTHNCVNALELAMAAALGLAAWFRGEFPAHEHEKRWGFRTPSTLKSTVVAGDNIKITTIPGSVVVKGDIRLTPFYDLSKAMTGALGWVERLDERIQAGETIDGFPSTAAADGRRGSVSLAFKGSSMEGIACDLESPGLAALRDSIQEVRGAAEPYSMTGSLPLVRDLQRRGFDVQITGFGQSSFYHAPNEQAELDHFRQGFRILTRLLDRL